MNVEFVLIFSKSFNELKDIFLKQMMTILKKKHWVVCELKKKSMFDILKHLPLTDDVILLIIDHVNYESEQDILIRINNNSKLYYYYNPPSVIEYQEFDLF